MSGLPVYQVDGRGIAHFTRPPRDPLEVVRYLHNGRPPLLPPEMGALVIGAGRVGYGFSRMAVRAGNADSLIMVLPNDIAAWYDLVVNNRNPRRLSPDLEFNPAGEKPVHILPPRGVREKMGSLGRMVSREPGRWKPVYDWAAGQLKDGRVELAADYWLAAARFQAITTRVGALASVVDGPYVRGLHPEANYTLLHATKSMGPPRQEGGRPLFGHELLQALLAEGGRADLVGRVVASAGFWVDTTVAEGEEVRLRFASTESRAAVEEASRVIGGSSGFNPLVAITMEVGRDAVFLDQIGGVLKNILAEILGLIAVRRGKRSGIARADPVSLDRDYSGTRAKLIRGCEVLAARAMEMEEIGTTGAVRFSREVIEDIMTCSTLNWSRFISKASQLGLFELSKRRSAAALTAAEVESLRDALRHFVRTAPVKDFGTTNETFAIVFGLAWFLAKEGLISSYRDVMGPISIPEGIRAMPYFVERFRGAQIPERISLFMDAFKPLWEG